MDDALEYPDDADGGEDWLLLALGTLILGGFAFWKYSSAFPPKPQLDAPVGKITVAGELLRRAPGAMVWEAIQHEAEIYAHDTLLTLPKESAEVVFRADDARMHLDPGTEVQIRHAERGRIQVLILQGNATATPTVRLLNARPESAPVSYSAPPPTNAAPPAPANVAPPPAPAPAPAAAPVTPPAPTAAVPAREVPMERPTAALPKMRGMASEARQSALEEVTRSTLARQPQLEETVPVKAAGGIALDKLSDFQVVPLGPPNDSSSDQEWITLTWTPVPIPEITYQVEISRTADFAKTILRPTKKNEVSAKFQGKGVFYWRVKALLRDDSITSESWSLNQLGSAESKTE